MTDPIRIMIDFETVDTCPRAGILSLGACTFGLPFGADRQLFYAKASLASNEQLKRSISRSTMEWWDKPENAEARKEAFSGTMAVDDVLEQFRIWAHSVALSSSGTKIEDIELWSRGAGFDCEILQDAFYQIFGNYPFDFRKHMCQRTIERLMPAALRNGIKLRTAKHIAYIDALNQADVMDVALRNLNFGKFAMQDSYAN